MADAEMSSSSAAAPAPRPSGGGGYGVRPGGAAALKASSAAASREPKDDGGESGPGNMKPGTRVFGKWRDGTERRAVVLERHAVKGADGKDVPGLYRYYVHWADLNRRMDSWLDHDKIRYDAEADAVAKSEKRTAAPGGGGPAALDANAADAAKLRAQGAGKKGKGAAASSSAAGGASSAASAAGGSAAGAGAGHGHGGHGGHGHGSGARLGDDVQEEHAEDGTVYRGRKRKADDTMVIDFVEPEHGADMTDELIREHEEVTKTKNINVIEVGHHRMETWYFSPLPKEYWPEQFWDTLHFCEFCLKFFKHKAELVHHCSKCRLRHPPGDEIYRDNNGLAFFEIDGAKEKQYAQNLSYIAKMFLDHKTLYHDVDYFLYYVLCEVDADGYHIVGYFSKEKFSEVGYNLSCILSLPAHQRKGYGRFLIQFSYALSKIEKKAGHPEKPLSDLGLLAYRSYWSWQLTKLLQEHVHRGQGGGAGAGAGGSSASLLHSSHASHAHLEELSILDIVKKTSIRPEDVIYTLRYLGLLRYSNGNHVLVLDTDVIDKEYAKHVAKPFPVVDEARIHWAPLRWLPAHIKKDKFLISAKISEAAAAAAGL